MICLILIKIVLLTYVYAQNNVKVKLVIPVNSSINLLKKSGAGYDRYSLSSFAFIEEPGNNLLPFLNNQPLFKIQAAPKKHLLIFTELSFTDLVENTLKSVDPGLLNKYDDHISELFKDAPSLFKLKCTIGL